MEWIKLEKYKKKFKALRSEIDSLQSYLSKIDEMRTGVSIISPYAISKVLSIPEIDAYFLLSLAEDEKLVHKVYKVWTNDDEYLLGEYDVKEQIPQKITNNATGKEVDKDHFYIDVVFEVA